MERLALLAFFALFLMNFNQASCAVTPVFVKKGDDVLLNVTEADVSEEFLLLSWTFTDVVLQTVTPDKDPKAGAKYTGRVELGENKFSVKLKNLQKSDSGVYTAQLTTGAHEITLAEYTITVQDPVSPVRLTVVPSSSDFCNITATCSTEDSYISSTFICENKTCYQEGETRSGITQAGASLQLYLSNKLIICNHSNHISQTKQEKWILDSCPQSDVESHNYHIPIVIIVAVVVIAIISGITYYLRKKGK